MIFELTATALAGLAGAGLAFLIYMVTRGGIPKAAIWIMGAVFALAFAVWSELNWFPRAIEQLPQGAVVTQTEVTQSALRPWTLLTPIVTRFVAVQQTREVRGAPEQRIVQVYLSERWQPPRTLRIGVDCVANAQTPLAPEATWRAPIEGEAWTPLSPDDPLIQTICK